MTLEQELEHGLAVLGLDFSAEQVARLNQYLALLDKWNKTYNLTAVRETERMVAYHVLDSLSALPHVQGGRVLDVGSGGGMPGMLFAIARTDERGPQFKWVGPIMPSRILLLARRDRQLSVARPADLSTYRIGVIRDDVGHHLLNSLNTLKQQPRYLEILDNYK